MLSYPCVYRSRPHTNFRLREKLQSEIERLRGGDQFDGQNAAQVRNDFAQMTSGCGRIGVLIFLSSGSRD